MTLEGCDEMVTVAIDIISSNLASLLVLTLKMNTEWSLDLLIFLIGCMEYGSYLQTPQDLFGSFNLSIRSIISKLKQKYQVDDNNNNSENQDGKYIKLLYLKELNPKFIQLQQDYEMFIHKFFS